MKIRFFAPLGAFALGSTIGTIAAIFAGYAVPGLIMGAIAFAAIVLIILSRSEKPIRPPPGAADWRRLKTARFGDNVERIAREGGTPVEIDHAARAIVAAGYGAEAAREFRELAGKALLARAPGAIRPAREITPACPDCGSTSENWRPEKDYCADCGRGVRVGASRGSLLQMFAAGALDETQLTQLALASGLSVRDVVDILDEAELMKNAGDGSST